MSPTFLIDERMTIALPNELQQPTIYLPSWAATLIAEPDIRVDRGVNFDLGMHCENAYWCINIVNDHQMRWSYYYVSDSMPHSNRKSREKCARSGVKQPYLDRVHIVRPSLTDCVANERIKRYKVGWHQDCLPLTFYSPPLKPLSKLVFSFHIVLNFPLHLSV